MTDQSAAGPPRPPVPPTTAGGTATPAGNGTGDWTDQVTDLIVDAVDKVRSRTTGPILEVARGSIYAVVALIILLPVGILFLAGLVRVLDYLLPGDVWVAYAVMAAAFLLIGTWLWSRRNPRPPARGAS